jgi:hypothetical protein
VSYTIRIERFVIQMETVMTQTTTKVTTIGPDPKVGDLVHYLDHELPDSPSTCRAATVTVVEDDGTVGLAVLYPDVLHFERNVAHDEDDRKPDSWHWPES